MKGLHPRILDWFEGKFGRFTAGQAGAIPEILEGRSVLLSAPTGTGKTLAAFLGVFDHLLRAQEAQVLPSGIVAVYVSPLRALAYDLQKNLQGPLEEIGLGFVRVGSRTGDTTAKERAAQRRRPPHILVTTPESLLLLLSQPKLADSFASLRYLVVDELHALAENKRGVHLMVSAERLEALAPRGLVRIGLSATIAPLEEMASYLGGGGKRPVIVAPPAEAERKTLIEVFSPLRRDPYPSAGYTAGRVMKELAALVAETRTTLIFTNTRSGAEGIGYGLKNAAPDLADRIEVHHASLDREIRLHVEDRLKRGELRAVVCSATLELGIDIGSVDLVVLISAPKGVARALQRIGRSGHAVDRVSRGILVATNINDLAECCVTARMAERRELEPVRIPRNNRDVLAQHLVALAAWGGFTPDAAFALVRRAYPYRDLPRGEFDRVLRYLAGGGKSLEQAYTETFGKVALAEGGALALPRPQVARQFYQNVGTIVSESMVRVRKGRRNLGEVEENFIKRVEPGGVFVLNGQTVRLVKTQFLTATVVDARGAVPNVPRWFANKMPLASGLAREVARMRERMARFFPEGGGPHDLAPAIEWLVEEYGITVRNAEALARQMAMQARVSVIPTTRELVAEIVREGNKVHYFLHSLIGRSANDALSRVLAWRVRRRKGGNALVTVDDYGLLLSLRDFQALDAEDWRALLNPEGAEADLRESLREADLVKWHFRGVAQTGLMVPRQVRGEARRPKVLQWSSDILFEVLQKHEPDHPLLEQAYEDATHGFLDIKRAVAFMEEALTLPVRWVPVERVSPFSFGIYVSGIKETMMMEDPETAIERLYHELYHDLERTADAA
ncbi:MAG: DEAD/DEAH box helicase [Verrucomicrobium sp.]|nr:DEAD/DEAH box helicase [Verrucomicrobium sp.]